jgi:TolB protein
VKKRFNPSSLAGRIFICLMSIAISHLLTVTVTHAKIYIDITSPGTRKLPISIISSDIPEAKTVGSIVKNDLIFSGIFLEVDPDLPGAEIRVNIELTESDGLKVVLVVYDLVQNRAVLKKSYESSKSIIRALSHSISNDIFRVVTGREGVFRTRIAYIKEVAGKKELHLMDWDGYNPRRIISNRLTSSLNWSHDGRYIVYSSMMGKKWVINILDLIKYEKRLLFSSKGLNLVGNITEDNRVVYSSSKGGSPEIYTMHTDNKRKRKLTRSYGIDVSPVFSPDGSEIAFVSDRGRTPQIYIMDSKGKKKRRITFEGNYNTSPAWSPDGKQIAFVGRRYGKNQIFVIESDGTNMRQLTLSGNNEEPTFSPDGIFIAFDSDRDGERGIYVMRINGEAQRRITPRGATVRTPRWSPYKK